MSPIRAVLIGLPWDHPQVGEHLMPFIKKAIEGVADQMAEAGFEYEYIAVTPEDGGAGLAEKLQSKRVDVVVIGNGVRGNMELTPFMEKLIEVVRTTVPQAKLAFNTLPDNSVDAVRRVAPGAHKIA